MSSKILRTLVSAARTRVAGSSSFVPLRAGVSYRDVHQSSPVLKKAKSKKQDVEESFELEQDQDEVDLFDLDTSSSPSTSNQSEKLEALRKDLDDLVKRHYAVSGNRLNDADHRAAKQSLNGGFRVGMLRRIVQLTPEEEVESLKGALKRWRIIGGRVTLQTAEEIVGRLCNMNRPDLALHLLERKDQYGIGSISLRTLTKLHHSLLSTSTSNPSSEAETPTPTPIPTLPALGPISPTLATLHLALRQRHANVSPAPTSGEVQRLLKRMQELKRDARLSAEWRQEGKRILDAAGGIWADAGRQIEARVGA